MLKYAFAAAQLLSLTSPALASNSDTGRVNSVLPIANAVLFNHDGGRSTPPACATVPGRWAIDVSTSSGQAKLSVLLTAYSLGKKISIVGAGTCDVWGDTETVNWFVIND